MTDIKTRIENAKKVITGNESLLDMLDADGATSLLNWGNDLAGQIAQSTEGMDDSSAELNIEPRLKALRQFMRSVGNWAAGKYADAESRAPLKDKLLEHVQTMNLAKFEISSASGLENLLMMGGNTQGQAILKLRDLLTTSG